MVLFDKKTFLILDCHEKEPKDEVEKYERLGTVIKHFKMSWYIIIVMRRVILIFIV